MLILPAIRLQERLCRRMPDGEEGTEGKYPTLPEDMVRMWRGENAKALHLIDEDGLAQQRISCPDLIRRMTEATDIPVQLAAGFVSVDDAVAAIHDLGCYRVILSETPDVVEIATGICERVGPRKLAVHLGIAVDGDLGVLTRVVERIRRVEAAGVERVIVRLSVPPSAPLPFEALLRLAQTVRASLTVHDGVRGFPDLRALQSLSPRRIDSLILDEALYANAFPCQRIWRLAEKRLIEENRLV